LTRIQQDIFDKLVVATNKVTDRDEAETAQIVEYRRLYYQVFRGYQDCTNVGIISVIYRTGGQISEESGGYG
jgi:hypothetical protein